MIPRRELNLSLALEASITFVISSRRLLPVDICSVCQDQLQTRGMPTDNINSQPRRRAGAGASPDPSGTPTTNVLHAGALGKIAMLSADTEGKITGCNHAALDAFGHNPTEVLGQPLAALFIRQDGPD